MTSHNDDDGDNHPRRPDLLHSHLSSDFKSSPAHLEKSSDGTTTEVYYPPTLQSMPDPPTVDMIKLGEQIQAEDQARGLWESLKRDRRMLLMAVPYLVAWWVVAEAPSPLLP
jgi:hypothetical protein